MKFKNLLVVALFIAFLAFTIQCVDQLLSPYCKPVGNGGFGWIAFQAWAVYFLAGCTIKGGFRSLFGYAMGILASIAIMEIGGCLGPLKFFAFPIAVFIVVVPVICLEKLPAFLLDFVPSVFVGAGVFFGFMTYVFVAKDSNYTNVYAQYIDAGTTEMIYCALGLFYGFMTVTFRANYEKWLAKK